MAKQKQTSLGDDELIGTPMAKATGKGPAEGEFIAPPDVPDVDEPEDALPEQEEFWRPPARFGTVPVEANPLGWDRRRGFRKLYPQVMLPIQVVERVSFGHPNLEPNRLFWGDNLHVMRQLPAESIDLIYIDPPFFSGQQYNIIFGDQNELRSFSDLWEGGMAGYLIWLNARLFEMKRLLRPSGAIFVHLDWHAAHYVKAELDKIFGHECFQNEIVWLYRRWPTKSKRFQRMHDTIFYYTKRSDGSHAFNLMHESSGARTLSDYGGKRLTTVQTQDGTWVKRQTEEISAGVPLRDVWEIKRVHTRGYERIGYPTQKPIELLQRLIDVASNPGDVIADFFMGGGSFLEAAMGVRMYPNAKDIPTKHFEPARARRWIGCDQSRVAVAITADRLGRAVEQMPLEASTSAIPDFTVEHWGVYEANRLASTPPEQFRAFVLRAFGAVPDDAEPGIHGHKGAVPIWVGDADQKSQVSAKDVQDFANAVRKTVHYQQDNLRDGIMLAWAFRPDAVQAADRLREMEATELNFIRLDLVRVDSHVFREHVLSLSTERADYGTFLTFVQPPKVEVGWRHVSGRTYQFDVSETVVLNAGAKIINVQWDFDYREHFTSTQGYSFARTGKKEPALQVDYTFPASGHRHIACKVQDDSGGEGLWAGEIEVK